MVKALYYGDNLEVLRQHLADASVDLIYLDPPFNSKATYNVLFRAPDGKRAEAQIEAFVDTWHWGEAAERAFHEVVHGPNAQAASLLTAMRQALGENDMMAYLTNMAVRLIELHRVLKPTGSLYLHCDPTASHYLKVLLDAVFGPRNFRNEIVWKRTHSHNFRAQQWPKEHDVILFYSKTDAFCYNDTFTKYSERQLQRYKIDETGRLYKAENLTFSTANPTRQFEWRGTKPPPNRSWGASLEQLEQWFAEGRILLKKDGTPRLDGLKVYLDDTQGKLVGSVWTDIERIPNTSNERLGYPTQKPLALLERIIAASSNPGEVVLDPFCGCGTTVHAAEKLGRQWIGIDITHLAISLIERRLKDAFPGLAFEVFGTPKDFASARDLAARDKHQFQWWAVSLVDAVPHAGKRKGADRGIDGVRFVQIGPNKGDLARVIVSVKGGEHVSVKDIRDLRGTVEREGALAGLFLTLTEPTKEMRKEAAAAGMVDIPFAHAPVPKLQIVTIAELLAGRRPDLPALGRHEGFKRTPLEKGRARQITLDL